MRPPPLTGFLVYLQEQDVPIGVSAHVAVDKLLARWSDSDPEALRDALAALLARSTTELQQIKDLFDHYYATGASSDLAREEPQTFVGPPFQRTTARATDSLAKTAYLIGSLAGASAALLIIMALWWGFLRYRTTLELSDAGATAVGNPIADLGFVTPPLDARVPEDASSPENPIFSDLSASTTKPENPIRPLSTGAPAISLTFSPYMFRVTSASGAAAFLLAFLVLYRARLRRERRVARREWAYAELARMPGPQIYTWRLQPLRSPLPRNDIDEFAILLHRLCAEPGTGRQLDVERTVERMARTGNMMVLSHHAQPLRRAIVLLIDYGHDTRVFATKLDALAEGVKRRGIPVAQWYFDSAADFVSTSPYGPPVPLSRALGSDHDVAILVLSYGSELSDPREKLPKWVEMLRKFPRCAILHPVADPEAWPRQLQRGFPISVWPMSWLGLRGAASVLAHDPALRASARMNRSRLLIDTPIDRESLRGLLRLVALVPRPTVEVVQLLRQLYYPTVPEQVLLHIVSATAGPGSSRLHLSAEETARLLAELRRTDAALEQAARRSLLEALTESAPPSDSAAYLRWRLDRALLELHIQPDPDAADSHDGGPKRAVAELLQLATSPILDEVADSLRALRLPGENAADSASTVPVETSLPPRAIHMLAQARVSAFALRIPVSISRPRLSSRDATSSLRTGAPSQASHWKQTVSEVLSKFVARTLAVRRDSWPSMDATPWQVGAAQHLKEWGRNGRWQSWKYGLIAIVLILVAVGVWLRLRHSPAPQVWAVQCAVLHGPPERPSCDLAENRLLSFLIVAPISAKLICESDRGPVRILRERHEEDDRLIEIEVPLGATSVAVWTSEGPFRSQKVSIVVRDQAAHEPPWLTMARQMFAAGRNNDAEALLRQHLNDAELQTGAHEGNALAHGLLAQIAIDRNDPTALSLLDQTLAESHREQLLSTEAYYSLRKVWLLGNQQHLYDKAEQFLQDQHGLFKQLPEYDLWQQMMQAELRKAQGDFPGALAANELAERPTRLFADTATLADLNYSRAQTLVLMGRMAEAKRLLDAVADSTSDNCRRGTLLIRKGWIQYRARQSLRRTDPLWLGFDPEPALNSAVEILQHCDLPLAMAEALTNRAHAAATLEKLEEVDHWLRRAKATLSNPTMGLEMEWAELDGQLALWRYDFASAIQHYQKLGRLGQKQDMYESVWSSLVGQAQATEVQTPLRAAELYARAEEYLDQRSLELPLSTGRGTFLGRFERGTALYLDLLVKQGQYTEAVQLIRRARARGLRALRLLGRANTLSDSQRRLWQQALVRYRKTRQELDDLAAGAAEDAVELREENQRVQQQRKRELLQQIDQMVRELGTTIPEKNFRSPQEGELMLTCHPSALQGWHCFVWDAKGTQYMHLDHMDEQHLDVMLVKARDKLQNAHQLHVIAYGEMRTIDVHDLPGPLAKQPIGEQLDVDYALDIPIENPPAAQTKEKQALFVVDAQGAMPNSRRSVAPIKQAMERAGWVVFMKSAVTRRIGNYPGMPQEGDTINSTQLRTLLGQVSLFHYAGHGDYVSQGVWLHRLQTDDETGLLLSDILMLPKAPERVLLFACQSGVSEEETGAIEGLGLAQAFLLRGSRWVIAAIRPVSDQNAAKLAITMYQRSQEPHGLASETPDPVGLLRSARNELLSRNKDPARRRDLASFRVFYP